MVLLFTAGGKSWHLETAGQKTRLAYVVLQKEVSSVKISTAIDLMLNSVAHDILRDADCHNQIT